MVILAFRDSGDAIVVRGYVAGAVAEHAEAAAYVVVAGHDAAAYAVVLVVAYAVVVDNVVVVAHAAVVIVACAEVGDYVLTRVVACAAIACLYAVVDLHAVAGRRYDARLPDLFQPQAVAEDAPADACLSPKRMWA